MNNRHGMYKLNGAHFLFFKRDSNLIEYLKELFPYVDLGYGFGLQGSMLNMMDAFYIIINDDVLKNEDKLLSLKNVDINVIQTEMQKIEQTMNNNNNHR